MFDSAERLSLPASSGLRFDPDSESGAQRWFERDPTPTILAGFDGLVLQVNPAGQKLIGEVVHLVEGRLVFADAAAQHAFEGAVSALASRTSDSVSAIVHCDDDCWRRVTVLDAGAADRNLMFVVLHVADGGEASASSLAEAFGLTPMECRVLGLLSGGASAKTIANQLGASPHTVRVHLRSLYGKVKVQGLRGLVREYTRLTS